MHYCYVFNTSFLCVHSVIAICEIRCICNSTKQYKYVAFIQLKQVAMRPGSFSTGIMAALIGQVGELVEGKEEWSQYAERVEH